MHQRQSPNAAPLLNQGTPFQAPPVNSGPVVTHPQMVTAAGPHQHATYSPIHHHRAAVNLVSEFLHKISTFVTGKIAV